MHSEGYVIWFWGHVWTVFCNVSRDVLLHSPLTETTFPLPFSLTNIANLGIADLTSTEPPRLTWPLWPTPRAAWAQTTTPSSTRTNTDSSNTLRRDEPHCQFRIGRLACFPHLTSLFPPKFSVSTSICFYVDLCCYQMHNWTVMTIGIRPNVKRTFQKSF